LEKELVRRGVSELATNGEVDRNWSVCNRGVRGVIHVKYRVLIAIQQWHVFVCEHPSSLPVPVVSTTSIPETKRFLWMTEQLKNIQVTKR
jgi:hypothetical protein